jgi:hypothetical protein
MSLNSWSAIENLWRKYLNLYGEPQVRTQLVQHWGNDPNISSGRIQFCFPPIFQPGYVGAKFFESRCRIVFLGYNPGEGRLSKSQDEDRVFAQELSAFANGRTSLAQLGQSQANHMVKWPIYEGKGILSEAGDSRISLLPRLARPSIQSIAILNLFPFKTVHNRKPFIGCRGTSASLSSEMWDCLVKPTIESLTPDLIVRYPESDRYSSQIESIQSKPRTIRVWHPSDYNLRAHRSRLQEEWKRLADDLIASAR